ncbi:hypothetical protein VC83_05540 [Pseudogymnoascus destructans]|uniref:Uncharacterized protein n=1 Tax=Pseudogymnoascus destructans TaxID=655981 RepID=A0A177A6F9_9PEZI|nr:uncharacterized protein VC83_05540 [Pseudogymnoascus destructans]OAF57748.1 hypothetical protein VC83_05540 [Pseudogymnoascus destructans]
MRAEFEEARDKMRAELDKVRAETRSELMTRMIEELGRGLADGKQGREGGRGAGTSKERETADPAPGVRDVSAVGEAMQLELKMARIEADGVRAETEGMRGEMDKMKVGPGTAQSERTRRAR